MRRMLPTRWRHRDERGAVAVMVGLLSVLLLTMAALGTDLGQAWAQKRQIQGGSDLATLAGAGISGNDLPAPSVGKVCSYGTGALATDPASVDVARYLASKAYSPTLAPAAVPAATVTAMATQLTDCNVQNGEVFYGQPTYNKATNTWTNAYNKNQLSLVSPPSKVDFGFARILGFNNVNVVGQSTVEIQSPKFSALPFYAFNGCDYGPQTLQQPNNGHSAAAVMLYKPGDNANATLTRSAPTTYPVDTTGTVTEPLVINGSGFTNVHAGRVLRVRERRRRSGSGDDLAPRLHHQLEHQDHDPRPARPDPRRLRGPGVLVHPRDDRRQVVDVLHRQQRQRRQRADADHR